MKKIVAIHIACAMAVLCALSLFVSCASSPGNAARISTVNVSMLSQDEVRHTGSGSTFTENPYLVPEGIVKGKPYEFIVLRVDFKLESATTVEIQAKTIDANGLSNVPLFGLEEMKSLWEAWPGKEADVLRRSDALERTYMPALVQKSSRGSRTWYLVFVGKNPIPRPTKVAVKAFIGESAPSVFEFELPALPAKK